MLAVEFFTVTTLWLQRVYGLFVIELGSPGVHVASCTHNPLSLSKIATGQALSRIRQERLPSDLTNSKINLSAELNVPRALNPGRPEPRRTVVRVHRIDAREIQYVEQWIGFLNELFYARSYIAAPAELSIPVLLDEKSTVVSQGIFSIWIDNHRDIAIF